MEENIKKELNLDTKVTVKNIAGWTVGFARIADGYGDVTIAPDGTTRLSRNEIIAQVQNGNKLFAGTDGMGSHATIYIDDAPTRAHIDFDRPDEGVSQEVFSDEKIKSLFTIKTQKSFEEKFKSAVRTRAEKYAAIRAIQRLNLNDFSKIRFVENYTGHKVL